MSKTIRQIDNVEVYNVVTRIHNQEDVSDGDITDRLDEFEYYNHVADYMIAALNFDSYDIDEDKVEDIIYEIEENGLASMPKIVISDTGDIIDGCHRVAALKKLGYTKIDLLKGTNEKFTPSFKKELINEDLEIYKISNDFGSISIMENAKYSPADNSVYEFLVDEKYRGLGVGIELLKEAMEQYPNLGAQVSSIASLKVFLECGFNPIDGIQKKEELNTTSYDFKTFQKEPELLNGQAAMYRQSITVFNEKMEKAISLFEENGQSLYFKDSRIPKPEIKSKNKMRM